MKNDLYGFVSLRADNAVFDIYISYRDLHIVSLLLCLNTNDSFLLILLFRGFLRLLMLR